MNKITIEISNPETDPNSEEWQVTLNGTVFGVTTTEDGLAPNPNIRDSWMYLAEEAISFYGDTEPCVATQSQKADPTEMVIELINQFNKPHSKLIVNLQGHILREIMAGYNENVIDHNVPGNQWVFHNIQIDADKTGISSRDMPMLVGDETVFTGNWLMKSTYQGETFAGRNRVKRVYWQ